MVFVDGENLAIRTLDSLKGKAPPDHVKMMVDTYVWTEVLEEALNLKDVVRKTYYTSVQGDSARASTVVDELKGLGFDQAKVFKRKRGRQSKQVDIALVNDLLMHAYRDNFDVAIIVTGDEDFIPAIESVCDEGKLVVLWYVQSGVSHRLIQAADHAYNLEAVLCEEREKARNAIYR